MANQHTLEIWNPSQSAVSEPTEYVADGYKSTTIGDNEWLNYAFNQVTLHCQIPVGAVLARMSSTYVGALICDGVSTIGAPASSATYAGDIYYNLYVILWAAQGLTTTPARGASAAAD